MMNSLQRLPIPVLILFLLLWARYPLFEFIIGFCYHVPLLSSFSAQVPLILIIAALIFSLPHVIKYIKFIDILLYTLTVSFYLFSKERNIDNAEALEYYTIPFLLMSVPYYFAGLSWDLSKLWRFMYYVSLLSIFLKGAYTFFMGGTETLESESMTAAYSLLPHLLFIIWFAISQKRIIDMVAVVVGILLLFAFGNRGTLVISVMFALFCFYQLVSSQKRNRNLMWLAGILSVVLIGVFFSGITDSIFSFLNSVGASVRVFEKSQTDGFFSSEGRLDIFYVVLPAIANNPFGLGIAGDRLLGVIYSHNIILEFLISYGWIFGTLLIVAIFAIFFVGLKKAQTTEQRVFVMLLFCSGILKLMVSGTYLNEYYLFFMIGYCVSMIRAKRAYKPIDN